MHVPTLLLSLCAFNSVWGETPQEHTGDSVELLQSSAQEERKPKEVHKPAHFKRKKSHEAKKRYYASYKRELRSTPQREEPMTDQEKDALRSTIVEACKRLDGLGIDYWLDRGTLISAARDGKIMRYDSDADLAYFSEDASKVQEAYETEWSKDLPDGMKLKYSPAKGDEGTKGPRPGYVAWQFWYGDHKQHADACELKEENGRVIDPYGNYHTSSTESHLGHVKRNLLNVSVDTVRPTQPCTIEGYEHCKCPNDVNTYLRSMYGKHWYIPAAKSNNIQRGLTLKDMANYTQRILDNPSPFLTDKMKQNLQKHLQKLEETPELE